MHRKTVLAQILARRSRGRIMLRRGSRRCNRERSRPMSARVMKLMHDSSPDSEKSGPATVHQETHLQSAPPYSSDSRSVSASETSSSEAVVQEPHLQPFPPYSALRRRHTTASVISTPSGSNPVTQRSFLRAYIPRLRYPEIPQQFSRTPSQPLLHPNENCGSRELRERYFTMAAVGCYHSCVWTEVTLDTGPQSCKYCNKLLDAWLLLCPECGLILCGTCKWRSWGDVTFENGNLEPDGMGSMRPENIIRRKEKEEDRKMEKKRDEEKRRMIMMEDNWKAKDDSDRVNYRFLDTWRKQS